MVILPPITQARPNIVTFVSRALRNVLLPPGYKMKKRVGAIEEFEFLPLTGGRQLHISIAITGWLSTGKYGKRRILGGILKMIVM